MSAVREGPLGELSTGSECSGKLLQRVESTRETTKGSGGLSGGAERIPKGESLSPQLKKLQLGGDDCKREKRAYGVRA